MFPRMKIKICYFRRATILNGLLFAAWLGLLAAPAGAQCANWDVSGEWAIIQEGENHPITVKLVQKDKSITGSAIHSVDGSGKLFTPFGAALTGSVKGGIDGDSFSVEISWSDGPTGVYYAKVLPSGKLDGGTFDKNRTEFRAAWHSNSTFKCRPLTSSATGILKPSPNKPKLPYNGNRTIEPPPSPGGSVPANPPKTSPPPIKVPGIVANKPIIPIPSGPTAIVVLTWDGGAKHPYAEVWVKVNGADETFVVEQGKGTQAFTVVRKTQYVYILTDAGKTLATVNIYVP